MIRLLLTLVTFLVGADTLAAQQTVLDQPISLAAENQFLLDVFYDLLEREAVPLSFRNDQIPARRITLHLRERPLREALDRLLAGTLLEYRLIGGQILLVARPQPRHYTISGFVEDGSSGERLIGANIVDARSGLGTATNEYGFFSLTLPNDPVDLLVSYLGYQAYRDRFLLEADRRLQVRLHASLMLEPIIVTAEPDSMHAFPLQPSALDPQLAKRLPSLAGEPDPLRVAQLLPGVTTGTDGLEGLHLRGSESGHNLVLLDGVPVYNIHHAAGLFSIFNTGTLRSVELYKSGIPTQYGGRLAGVLDIRTKEGNLYDYQAEAELGLLTGRLLVEGPILEGKSSFLLGGRWSFVHHLLNDLSRDYKARQQESGLTDYRFNDLNLKFNHIFSPRDRVYLSWYQGNDDYLDQARQTDTLVLQNANGVTYQWQTDQSHHEHLGWGNRVAALRWNHLFSDKFFSNLTLTYSRLAVHGGFHRSDSLLELSTRQVLRAFSLGRYESGIRDLGLRFDGHYLPAPGADVRFGAAWTHHRFLPLVISADESSEVQQEPAGARQALHARELNAYAHLRHDHPAWWWQAGLHLSLWQIRRASYLDLQPRLQLGLRLGPRMQWVSSYDRTVQPVHLLSSSTIGLPTDLWVPATDQLPPASADQLSSGFDFRLAPGWTLETDVYFKRLHHLVNFSEGVTNFADWEANVTTGEGKAYGLELLLTHRQGPLTGWMAYTLARSVRDFERINLGRPFPFKYDRRHDLKLAAVYQLRPWLSLAANWIFSTGSAFSLSLEHYRLAIPDQQIIYDGVEVLVFGSKNQFRLPPYHRLDIGATIDFHAGRGHLRHQLHLGVFNLYDRRNPIYYDLRTTYIERENQLFAERNFVQVWLAPRLPSISYQLKFQ